MVVLLVAVVTMAVEGWAEAGRVVAESRVLVAALAVEVMAVEMPELEEVGKVAEVLAAAEWVEGVLVEGVKAMEGLVAVARAKEVWVAVALAEEVMVAVAWVAVVLVAAAWEVEVWGGRMAAGLMVVAMLVVQVAVAALAAWGHRPFPWRKKPPVEWNRLDRQLLCYPHPLPHCQRTVVRCQGRSVSIRTGRMGKLSLVASGEA